MRGNRVPDATILIHETHRELWGISAEELDARAWENTLRDLPVRTDSLMVYLKEEYGVCLLYTSGVASAEVSHEKGTAVVTLTAPVSDDVLKTAVEAQDYTVKGIQ